MKFDTRAWLIWVLAAAAVTMTLRNPLYSLLLLIVSRVVDWSHSRADGAVSIKLARLSALRMAALVLLFSGLFSALFVHAGQTTLFLIPEQVPLLGGIVTLESFLSGASNGLLLLTLLSFFLAFNHIVPADKLARLAPRAFQDLGVVVLVALTYVPETVQHIKRIREAQAVRGHRIKGIRDWQPLLIPLLVGGMERAMALAEAMVARGFGATSRAPVSSKMVAALAGAMGLTFGGWTIALWWEWPGWVMMVAGIIVIGGVVWTAGRHVSVTQYRPRLWQGQDTIVVFCAILPLVSLLLPNPLVDQETLTMNFLSGLRWPPFDPLSGILILLYAIPAFVDLFPIITVAKDYHDHH